MIGFKPTTLRLWLAISVLWIAGVFYVEALDGQLSKELGEVLLTALVLPVLPGIVFPRLVRANIAAIERVFLPPLLVIAALAAIAYTTNRLVLG